MKTRCRNGASSHVPEDARGGEKDGTSEPPETFMRKPHARKVYETVIESEQKQDATVEEDVPEVVLSVEEDELVEDFARDDSVVADSEFRRALRQRSLLDRKPGKVCWSR